MAVQNESLAADSNVNKLNIFNVTTQFTIQFQNVVDLKQLFIKKSIENPRVTGSIPVQATNPKAQLFSVGLFLCPQPRIYGPFQLLYVCLDPSRVSIEMGFSTLYPSLFLKKYPKLRMAGTRKSA